MKNPVKPFFVFACAMVAAGCGSKEAAAPPVVHEAPVPVGVVSVQRQKWPVVYEANGTVRARTAVALSSRTVAYVREVRAETGDRVREGQVLATLDAREAETALRNAEAAREEARSGIAEGDSAIASARANLELSQSTYRRMKELFDKTSISEHEFDEVRAKLRVAEAAQDMSLARRRQLDSKIAQADQGVQAAQVMLTYSRIVAPFAGIITEKNVQAGLLASPGATLFTIEQAAGYRLEVPVEESRLAAVRAGGTVAIRFDGSGQSVQARVSEVAPAVDAVSHSFLVKIDLPASVKVSSGMFGRAVFELGDAEALAIPVTAVREQGQLATVFVAEGGKARARIVTRGRVAGELVEILTGISAGEALINPVPAGLKDGAEIGVRQ